MTNEYNLHNNICPTITPSSMNSRHRSEENWAHQTTTTTMYILLYSAQKYLHLRSSQSWRTNVYSIFGALQNNNNKKVVDGMF